MAKGYISMRLSQADMRELVMALRPGAREDFERAHDKFDSEQRLITVCDACLQASCWQGLFYCDHFKTAGTKQLTVATLRELAREHPDNWRTDEELEHG